MRNPKKVILINNMRRVEDYLGLDFSAENPLKFVELQKNIGTPGVLELLRMIPEAYDSGKMKAFYEETGLKVMAEVYRDNCELTMYDKDGRYPREDAAVWNRDFMGRIEDHPEWLEPQEEPDLLVRYFFSFNDMPREDADGYAGRKDAERKRQGKLILLLRVTEEE